MWWLDKVGYEVYLRSFADGDGDGVGDLRGLRERLEYVAWLGVGIVWVTPFYPSPMQDHGYDVADYTGVDPLFGSLEAFDEVVAAAHDLGLRLVIDLVPNHSSSEHPWFRRARSSRDDPYRDYYIWRDPVGGGPPNNWLSQFGGPAWTLDESTGQYWLHLYLPEQPDLNWANPAVADEFDRILRFWLDRGVDGFRIDVAHGLVKHPELLDNPEAPVHERLSGPGRAASSQVLKRIYDIDQPGVHEVYRRWRTVVEPYGAMLLGEVYLRDPERVARYVHDEGLHLSFWFEPLQVAWEPAAIRQVLAGAVGAAPGRIAWVQGSHDRSRAASRFGGGAVGKTRSLALATLLVGLPGVPFVYQGEELGLEDVEIPPELVADPIALRTGEYAGGRDRARTPMPWEPGPGYGFTRPGVVPWLPFGQYAAGDTVAAQRGDPGSLLARYRRLLGLRRRLENLRAEPLAWVDRDGEVLAYRRGAVVVTANCGDREEQHEPPAGRWTVRFDTCGALDDRPAPAALRLAPAQALVLEASG